MAYDPQDAQALRDYVNSLRQQTNYLNGLTRAFQQHNNTVRESGAVSKTVNRAIRNYSDTLDNGIKNVSSGLKMLGRDADSARDAFSYFAKTALGAFGGRAIGEIVDYVGDLTSTYKRMSEAGQSFTGGIFEMAKSAAQSGMSLREYADMMTKNSAVASQLANRGGLGALAKQVRVSAEEFGQFGYTMQGLNDLTGTYLDNLRLTGQLDDLNSDRASKAIVQLAKQTSELSIAFGKHRAEITKTTAEAMKNASFQAKVLQMSGDAGQKYTETITAAVNALAAQQGPAGSFLSQYLTGIAGGNGLGLYTPQAEVFNNIGMGYINQMMEKYYQRMQQANPEDQIDIANDLVGDLRTQIQQQLPMLQSYAAWGDKNAQQIIELYANLKTRTAEQIAEDKKKAAQQEKITKAMLNFENVWGRVTGAIREKLYPVLSGVLSSLVKSWDDFSKTDTAKRLMDQFNDLGVRFEKWATTAFNEENMKGVSEWVTWFLSMGSEGLIPAVKGIKDNIETIGGFLKSFGLAVVGATAVILGAKTVGAVAGATKAVGGLFKGTASAAAAGGGAAAAAAGAGGGMLRKGLGFGGKALGVAGLGIEAFTAYADIKEIMAKHDAGQISDEEYRAQMIKAISGHMGSVAGGVALGGIGSLAGPLGTMIGAGAGSYLGGKFGGSLGGDWAAGKIFDNFFANGQPNQGSATPSERSSGNEEINRLTQRLAEAERRLAELSDEATNGPAAKMVQLISEIQELKKAIKDQTEVLAAQNNYISSLLDRSIRNQRSTNFGD